MTAAAPAASAIRAWSALTTSMMTPPFSISASPTFSRNVSRPCRPSCSTTPAHDSWPTDSLRHTTGAANDAPVLDCASSTASPSSAIPRSMSRRSTRDTERRTLGRSTPAGSKSCPGATATPRAAAASATRRPETPSGRCSQKSGFEPSAPHQETPGRYRDSASARFRRAQHHFLGAAGPRLPVRSGAQKRRDGRLQRHGGLKIRGLLDACQLLDDRTGRGDPADPKPRNEVLGQRAEPHNALGRARRERDPSRLGLLVAILDDEGARRERGVENGGAAFFGHRDAGRVLALGHEVDELRAARFQRPRIRALGVHGQGQDRDAGEPRQRERPGVASATPRRRRRRDR